MVPKGFFHPWVMHGRLVVDISSVSIYCLYHIGQTLAQQYKSKVINLYFINHWPAFSLLQTTFCAPPHCMPLVSEPSMSGGELLESPNHKLDPTWSQSMTFEFFQKWWENDKMHAKSCRNNDHGFKPFEAIETAFTSSRRPPQQQLLWFVIILLFINLCFHNFGKLAKFHVASCSYNRTILTPKVKTRK